MPAMASRLWAVCRAGAAAFAWGGRRRVFIVGLALPRRGAAASVLKPAVYEINQVVTDRGLRECVNVVPDNATEHFKTGNKRAFSKG
jgi:hypothetical protein